jgi:hypothetical protein
MRDGPKTSALHVQHTSTAFPTHGENLSVVGSRSFPDVSIDQQRQEMAQKPIVVYCPLVGSTVRL